ncbi:MAG: hypothetical protein QOE70_864 [Chthoniobacter sp.]|jgi:hypothetical protein|nr:hypothetical protein [Chthoniobacter sp.]
MQILSPEQVLAVWEAGRHQHELDRALTLLAAGSPELSRGELAALSIGERDARLLRLRTLMLGPRAAGFAECPECAVGVELPIDTAAFEQAREPAAEAREIEVDGTRIRFRLPTSRDLAEAVAAPNEREGLHRLIECCVLDVRGDDASDLRHWRPELVEKLSRAMLEADPQAEITLALECPGCGHRWEMFFEIAVFFWKELAAQARRLLREIDVLARAYGWSEREILSLPARRRQSYLELVTE